MKLSIDHELIKQRKETLDDCRAYLKEQFIGIDKIIDQLIDYIQVWYLMPDILTRPIIINLWGMTGVGKTDLIRKLVKFLHFQDRFVEIELSNTDESSWRSSVSEILSDNRMQDEKPAIILFDEIQRFNTMNDDGSPLNQTKYKDFWELLSDGRLSKKDRYDIDSYLYRIMNRKKENDRKRKRGEEIDEDKEYLTPWQAREFKRNLNLDLGIEDMVDMTEDEMLGILLHSKKEKKIYEPVNHSKTLIIVSGNLDEAFRMATQTSEADIDADIFHAFTKKITFVDVKNALSRKFRPEQVARFGNIHLIYTSLKKTDFKALISKEIKRVIADTKEKVGIKLSVDQSIHNLIYRNGVFPVQGVRPVYSSVIDILETNLSKYLFEAIMDGSKSIALKYDRQEQAIMAKIGRRMVKTPYIGRIDKIRQASEINNVVNISVHEAGHAVAYMLLLGLVPLQVKSKISSSYASGFTFPHQIHETKETILKKIKIYLAGGLAEEIVFGRDYASIGRSNDRIEATKLAADYVRRYGFDDEFQSVYTIDEYPYTLAKKETDLDIEKMITRLLADTKELLQQHRPLLISLSDHLEEQGSADADEMVALAKTHGLKVKKKPEGYLYIADYKKLKAKK